jgi:hypothetical protein
LHADIQRLQTSAALIGQQRRPTISHFIDSLLHIVHAEVFDSRALVKLFPSNASRYRRLRQVLIERARPPP